MDITVIAAPPLPDATTAEWMSGLAREWADDLGDQQQDIYTIADGAPVDAP